MAKLEKISRDVDDRIQDLLAPERDRIIFVANNHLIGADAFEQLRIVPGDTLVQFNLAPHFEIFRDADCHKIHVFNYGEGQWWGFSSGGAPAHAFLEQKSQSIVMLFKLYLNPAIKSYLQENAGLVKGGIINGNDFPNNAYTEGKGPSIGYLTLVYFRFVNTLRFLMRLPPLKLVMLGFSGKYEAGKAWSGHDFSYEQKVYATWLELIRLDHNGDSERPRA